MRLCLCLCLRHLHLCLWLCLSMPHFGEIKINSFGYFHSGF